MSGAGKPPVPGQVWPLEDIHFEPWKDDPDGEGYYPPSKEGWRQLTVTVQLAFGLNCATKAKLAEILGSEELARYDGPLDDLAGSIEAATEDLEKTIAMLRCAEAWLYAVGAADLGIEIPSANAGAELTTGMAARNAEWETGRG